MVWRGVERDDWQRGQDEGKTSLALTATTFAIGSTDRNEDVEFVEESFFSVPKKYLTLFTL